MNATVLVVDAEQHLCNVIRYTLEREGYVVFTSCSGEQALELLMESTLPDAVVIGDVHPMPEGRLNFACRVRFASAAHNMPIIMVSTQVQPQDVKNGLNAGANRYLAKPFHLRELISTVRELLGSKTSTHVR